jgi:hypothetical protein
MQLTAGRRRAASFLLCVSAVALASSARDAAAAGPIDGEVAAGATFGTSPTGSPGDPLGIGIGARAGASILGFYAGADVRYFFGSGTSHLQFDTVKERALKVGVDVGYSFTVAPLILRPLLGAGDLLVFSSVSPPTGQAEPVGAGNVVPPPYSVNEGYAEAALTAILPLDRFFVAVDTAVLVVQNPGASCCGSTGTAVTIDAEAGMRF